MKQNSAQDPFTGRAKGSRKIILKQGMVQVSVQVSVCIMMVSESREKGSYVLLMFQAWVTVEIVLPLSAHGKQEWSLN